MRWLEKCETWLEYFNALGRSDKTLINEMIQYLGDLLQNNLERWGFRRYKIGHDLVILNVSDRKFVMFGSPPWLSPRTHILVWSLPIYRLDLWLTLEGLAASTSALLGSLNHHGRNLDSLQKRPCGEATQRGRDPKDTWRANAWGCYDVSANASLIQTTLRF